jgi:glycosyltransferase involved in cell wall biosynthesis
MRIGLNLLFLLPNEVGGTETYATSLIEAISNIDHQNEYFLFVNAESAGKQWNVGPNFHPVTCPIRATNRAARFVWEQLVFPFQAIQYRLDVVHSLGYTSPRFLCAKSVVTIHDLNYLAIPQAFTPFTRWVQKIFVTQSAKRADHIITVSHFVCREIVHHLGVRSSKITTVYEAPKNLASRAAASPVGLRTEFGITQPYILAFSSRSPHKNIARLVEAFQQAIPFLRDDYQLIIAGHLPTSNVVPSSENESLSGSNRVITTGFIEDHEIFSLLSNATLLAFPSLYEGFGLPVLEAMDLSIPVICSRAASLPEIVEDAAYMFDPYNVNEISRCLIAVLNDPIAQEKLIEKGVQNRKRFSWERAARETLQVYTRVTSDQDTNVCK